MAYKQKFTSRKRLLWLLPCAVMLFAGVVQYRGDSKVGALTSSELRAQSQQLEQAIADSNKKAKELSQQAETLKTAIASLDIDIEKKNNEIELTSVKIAQLTDELDKAQLELDRQKDLLKASMRELYKRRGASTVELLVASDSFSQFMNDQEYLERLKVGIQDSTEKVIVLKQQITAQKTEQETLKAQQEDQRAQLDATRLERANLLAQTQGDEARYQSLVETLKTQQAEVNKALFAQVRLERGDGNNGGYPYNDYAFSMVPYACGPGEGPDRWGYCTRQCVSYVAWAVERSGKKAPMYWGNARDWYSAALSASSQAAGIRVDRTPTKDSVAVYTSGSYGHVQYVEDVNGNGTMRISQYNAELTGQYSEATVASSRFDLFFIHFP